MLPWILGKITSDNGDGNCEGNLEWKKKEN